MKSQKLYDEIDSHLKNIVLKFWVDHGFDYENEVFYPLIGRKGEALQPENKKYETRSCILCARLLWTFSKAYARFQKDEYKKCADIAYNNLMKYFYDGKNGGFYWSIDYLLKNPDTRKHLYVQSFVIYGLAEYYIAFKNEDALNKANELFDIINEKCRDRINGGFYENFDSDWNRIAKFALAPPYIDCDKTMNSMLHFMEGLTLLYIAEKSGGKKNEVKKVIYEIVGIIFSKMINEDMTSLYMYYTKDFKRVSDSRSPGHDIETSWLICRTCDTLGDKNLIRKARDFAFRAVEGVIKNGYDTNKTIITSIGDTQKNEKMKMLRDWWAEAEGIVGLYNIYQITGDEYFFKKCLELWETTKRLYVDFEYGEWFSFTVENEEENLIIREHGNKASFWKCPYHNSRMCFELLGRMEE